MTKKILNTKNKSNDDLATYKKIALQRFLTLGELTSSISYELKNLLISLSENLELAIKKNIKQDDISADLNQIKKTADISKNIFMELLSLSCVKDHISQKEKTNVNKIIKEILVILSAKKQINYDLQLDKNLPNMLIYPLKIKEVLINIIMNAIDSYNGKNGDITISTGKLPYLYGIYIQIKDYGCGMDNKILENLFNPFYTTKANGTGFGLSACMDIIKEHCGNIYVSSILEKGTTISITIPNENFTSHPDIIDL